MSSTGTPIPSPVLIGLASIFMFLMVVSQTEDAAPKMNLLGFVCLGGYPASITVCLGKCSILYCFDCVDVYHAEDTVCLENNCLLRVQLSMQGFSDLLFVVINCFDCVDVYHAEDAVCLGFDSVLLKSCGCLPCRRYSLLGKQLCDSVLL
eukprot:TRINITY_DN22504_c0_g1_i1.p1 TRINITY_DN22504_c0_g1~~TRINITY_DN22504_c0_g1_i1.p1  ORF type:complete len:150 (-),score=17.77 TRINITY_DN22504_c0_g1_i1:51-500(-)